MGTELARYAPPIDELKQTAELLAMSGYFDAKGTATQAVAQLATKILAGRELGYGPFTSANGIHIIQGRPAISANLMAAAVKASGRYDYRVKTMTAEAVVIEFFQLVNGKRELLGESPFTAADAKAAGTQNMQKFARNMLFARAMSNGVKWFCPDVFNGNAVYVLEELGAEVDGEGNVIDVAPRIIEQGGAAQTPTVSHREQPNNTRSSDSILPAVGHGTGEDTPKVYAHDETVNSPLPPGVPSFVADWQNVDDAFAWAIQVGACRDTYHARGSMKKVVDEQFNGKFTNVNRLGVFVAYWQRQTDKLNGVVPVDNPFVDEAEAVTA
jgi:hypothetical protein